MTAAPLQLVRQVEMEDYLKGTGIEPADIEKFVAEQVYSLPGTDRHRECFTVLLTGSRAIGAHSPTSDVDVEVICPQAIYDRVHAASLEAGLIDSPKSFFRVVKKGDDDRYFGAGTGLPHFSLTPLERLERQIAGFEDVPLWIWTNARIVADPGGQFRKVLADSDGYPKDVLVRKIKYHWLLEAYWSIETYPHHARGDNELLPAATAILNSINEFLRLFFLVEGRPYPYAEKLMPLAEQTKLGLRFCPLLRDAVNQVVAPTGEDSAVWQRLDRVFETLYCCDLSERAQKFQEACGDAMIEAGVDPGWVAADFQNIDELLSGELGPRP